MYVASYVVRMEEKRRQIHGYTEESKLHAYNIACKDYQPDKIRAKKKKERNKNENKETSLHSESDPPTDLGCCCGKRQCGHQSGMVGGDLCLIIAVLGQVRQAVTATDSDSIS